MHIERITSAVRDIVDPAMPTENQDGMTRQIRLHMPYPAHMDGEECVINIPVGNLPAPMFTEELVKHCIDILGKRDATKVLDGLVDEYYRQLVLKQI